MRKGFTIQGEDSATASMPLNTGIIGNCAKQLPAKARIIYSEGLNIQGADTSVTGEQWNTEMKIAQTFTTIARTLTANAQTLYTQIVCFIKG